MKAKTYRILYALFGVALALQIGVAVLCYFAMNRSIIAKQWVGHTHAVQTDLTALYLSVLEAEDARRGFILTGDAHQLEPYRAAVKAIPEESRGLRILIADPVQLRRLDTLGPLIEKRMALIADSVHLAEHSNKVARQVSLTKKGELAIAEVRTAILEMEAAEDALLAKRVVDSERFYHSAISLLVAGSCIALGLLLTVCLFLTHAVHKRQLAEELALASNTKLEARTFEMEAINEELEAFAYSVSHDLRAPLRHIHGFSKILLEDSGPKMEPDAQKLLQRIQEATKQMGRLVDDLLNLSRLGRQDINVQITGLCALVKEAIEDLKPEIGERKIDWNIGKLPSVECDAGLMKQVFANLLSNALKYTRPKEHAIIEVGQATTDGRAEIFVRDNGVGFNMKYADKLFGVFQRLHRQEDFEGTGVGLATVLRIINKHGGQIRAEAELDKGAAFYFTLGARGSAQEIENRRETEYGRKRNRDLTGRRQSRGPGAHPPCPAA
jgi:signal transduction histidine kinase